MKLLNAIGITVIATFLLFGQSHAQSFYALPDMNHLSVGARALGLAGAISPVVDDASSLYWNPAGLGKIEDLHISFEVRAPLAFPPGITGISNHTLADSPYSPYADGTYAFNEGDIELQMPMGANTLNNVILAYPIRINDFKLSVAAGHYKLMDFNSDDACYVSYTNFFALKTNVSSGTVNVNSAAFAFSIDRSFSFGFSMNFLSGTVNREQGHYGGIFTTMPGDMFDKDLYQVIINETIGETSYSARYAEWGLQYRPFGLLEFGAKFTKDYTLTREITVNEITTVHKTKVPMFFTGGVAMHLGSGFRFIGDYHTQDWSRSLNTIQGAEIPDYPLTDHNMQTWHFAMETGNTNPEIGGGGFRLGYKEKKYLSKGGDNKQLTSHVATIGFSTIGKHFDFHLGIEAEIRNDWSLYALKGFDDGVNYTGQLLTVQTQFTIKL